jgi:tetratricopeptide (TPR) repeat protein
MKRKWLASEKGLLGISPIKLLLTLFAIFILIPAVLSMVSKLYPDLFASYALSVLMENIRQRTVAAFRDVWDMGGSVKDSASETLRRGIRSGREKWVELTERVPPLPEEVGEEWADDMNRLIQIAEQNGYDMKDIIGLIERFKLQGLPGGCTGPDKLIPYISPRRVPQGQLPEGAPSPTPTPLPWWQGSNWWKVENAFWKSLEDQTFEEIRKSLYVFRQRTLGCGDFTPLVQKVDNIVEKFNDHTLEGYTEAMLASQQLREFRVEDSKEFTTDLLNYMIRSGQYLPTSSRQEEDWYQKVMIEAIDKSKPKRYPSLIDEIDRRATSSNNLLQVAFANTIVAEIYLNYDLIRPTEDRYEEAIRALTKQVQFLPGNIDLHMAMGLLHERVCKNSDLAIKEFKEVVALSRQANRECQYAVAHFHLGLLYLNIRPRPTMEITPVVPTPGIPVPTRPPGSTYPYKEERESERRAVRPERPQTGGSLSERDRIYDRRPERPRIIQRNIRPRQKISEAKGILFRNFADISPDSAREFEEYLTCQTQGVQAKNAEFFHQKYIEAIREQ